MDEDHVPRPFAMKTALYTVKQRMDKVEKNKKITNKAHGPQLYCSPCALLSIYLKPPFCAKSETSSPNFSKLCLNLSIKSCACSLYDSGLLQAFIGFSNV